MKRREIDSRSSFDRTGLMKKGHEVVILIFVWLPVHLGRERRSGYRLGWKSEKCSQEISFNHRGNPMGTS